MAMAVSRPTVQTLDDAGLENSARMLAVEVGGFDPEVIVGIATGGVPVAHGVSRELPGSPPVVTVKSQRPGTNVKRGALVSRSIKALPRVVADVARWAEVEFREARYYYAQHRRPHSADLSGSGMRIVDPDALRDGVAGAQRVLVVDDTLDSGQTIAGVVEAVRRAVPRADIRTAVIATTWRRPPLRPDYVLRPRLLLRLPSSFDA